MKVVDLFSGIGGFSIAFEREGFETVAFSEIERFPSQVLAHHWPDIPNLGDITKINGEDIGTVDVITGGFPCQDLSVAGKRRGLEGNRSGLFWQIIRLAGETRAPWLVLENVPGLLSSNKGRDFGIVLDALGELGYGLSWRVLDAQYFGVPQRRRRVFIVGHLGGACPPEVLFEREGVRGDTEEGGEERQEVAALSANGVGTCDADDNQARGGHLVAGGLTSRYGKGVNSSVDDGAIVATGFYSTGGTHGVSPVEDGRNFESQEELAYALTNPGSGGRPDSRSLVQGMAVRRLTPRECERLMGLPDDFTDIPGASDSARYRALGNTVAVPCVQWIARRLMRVAKQEVLF